VLTNEFEEESFGGAATAATGIAHMLEQAGVEQTVVVPRSDCQEACWLERSENLRILKLPRNSRYFGYLGMIKADVLREQFPELWQDWELIHIQAINFTPLAYALAQERIPLLYSVYSFLREELGNRPEAGLQAQFAIQEELLTRCQGIHLISQSQRSYLAGHFPELLAKTAVLPLGINRPAVRWKQKNSNRFLYLGRLLDYKGVEDLIRAVERVTRNRHQLHLDIVGKGTDAYVKYLKSLVVTQKLENNIQFHGWRPTQEVRQWMTQAAALVVPSRREAFGLVALEGMAVGTPLIVSRAGGLSELANEQYALTFEPGSIRQLAEALIIALNSPVRCQQFSQRGLERALDFEWSRLIPQYLALLEKVSSLC
jgi:glycogen(starch) synthase